MEMMIILKGKAITRVAAGNGFLVLNHIFVILIMEIISLRVMIITKVHGRCLRVTMEL